MVLWELFHTFLLMGFVSYGGGYAMIPIIEAAVSEYGWMSAEQLTNMIAIAGMSPGPIAANSAILVGYSTAGLKGAIISAIAILLGAAIGTISIWVKRKLGYKVDLKQNKENGPTKNPDYFMGAGI